MKEGDLPLMQYVIISAIMFILVLLHLKFDKKNRFSKTLLKFYLAIGVLSIFGGLFYCLIQKNHLAFQSVMLGVPFGILGYFGLKKQRKNEQENP